MDVHERVPDVDSRWVQVNNTVVPIVHRAIHNGYRTRLVPLPVLQYGAGLLRDVALNTTEATLDECQELGELCQNAGFYFSFSPGTELVQMHQLLNVCRGAVTCSILPGLEPFRHAKLQLDDGLGDPDMAGISYCMKETDPDLPLDLSISSTQERDQTSLCVDLAVSAINNRKSPAPLKRPREVATKYLWGRKLTCLVKDNNVYVTIRDIHATFYSHISAYIFGRIINRVGTPLVDVIPEHSPIVRPLPASGQLIDKMVAFGNAADLLMRIKRILIRMEQYRRCHEHAMRSHRARLNETGTSSPSSKDGTATTLSSNGQHVLNIPRCSPKQYNLTTTSEPNRNMISTELGLLTNYSNNVGNNTEDTPSVVPHSKSNLVSNSLKRKRLLDTVTKLLIKKEKIY